VIDYTKWGEDMKTVIENGHLRFLDWQVVASMMADGRVTLEIQGQASGFQNTL
jgi:hypothetical protein